MSLKLTIIKNIAKLTASGYSANVVYLFKGIINAGLMGPTNYGIWRGVNIFSGYSNHIHSGVLNAMMLEIPVCYGKKEYGRVEKIRNTAFTFMLLMIVLLAATSFSASFFFHDRVIANVIKIMSVVIILKLMNMFYGALLAIDQKFDFISKLIFIQALLDITLTYFLVKAFNIYGAAATNILVLIFSICVITHFSDYKIRLSIDYPILRYLLIIGFPILMPVILREILTTVDKILIINYLGNTVFGYYSITMMVSMVILFIPAVIIATIQPRMYEKYGKDETVESIKHHFLKPLFVTAYLLPLLIGILYILFPLAVKFLLKDYIAGIDALKLSLIGMSFYSLSFLPVSLLNLLKMQKKLLVIFTISIIFSVSCIYIILVSGFGINGVAIITSITHLLLSAGIIYFALKFYFKSLWRRFLYIAEMFLPTIILFAVFYFIDYCLCFHKD